MIWPIILLMVVIMPWMSYWAYWRWTHKRMLELGQMVPGPPQWPIIGNAYIFIANPKEQLNIIGGMLNQYGQYLRFWLGPDLNICVKNPSDVRMLLTSNKLNQKGPVYEFMKLFIGPGLLTGGSTWRNHRKIVTSAYGKKSVERFSKIFNKETEYLLRTLTNKDPNIPFNIYDDILKCTTQCVCQTLMGLSKEDSMDIKNLDRILLETPRLYSFIFKKMTRWWLQIPIIYWLVGGKKKEIYYIELIYGMISDIVEKRRKSLKMESNEDEDVLGVVDRYIMCGELTEQEIKFETFTVFTTSQEASAKIASAVLLFLSHLPDWQEKVYNEIIDVLGPNDDEVTDDHLKKLEYLDMVYKEALRYLSIAALIQRTVRKEISINGGKWTLPVGTSLAIPIHELHRDPTHWADPEKVMPERFLQENVQRRDPNAFIPFSLGPMDCLGRVYATAIIKTIVVRVLRHLRLEAWGPPPHELELHVAISVKFADGYNLKVHPRNHRFHPR